MSSQLLTARRQPAVWVIALAVMLQASPAAAHEHTVQQPAEPPASRIGLFYRPNHVSLRVADLQRSVAWWRDVFGAQVVRRSTVGEIAPGAEIAFMHIADGFHVELVGGGQVRRAAPPPADIRADYALAGWKHVGFLVHDMDRVIAHLKSRDVDIGYDTVRHDYGVRIVLIREPSGHFIELYAPLQ